LQGAILRVKLPYLERWTDARRAIAAKYKQQLADSGLALPPEMPWARHVYHIYSLRTPDRDSFRAALELQGIQTGVHYAIPVHLQPGYADLRYQKGSFPESEAAAQEVVALPIYAELGQDQVDAVCRAVTKVAAGRVKAFV
jgi:dTDP-4-amino-4,6-dideoxygalactose transaminase